MALEPETAGLIFNTIGHVGVVCFLLAFWLLQKETLKSDSLMYLGLNAVGAIFIIISLMWNFNLPAFILECCWALISFYGIFKTLRKRRRAQV